MRNTQLLGITLVRLAVGIIFAAHGAQKVFTMGFGGVAGFFGQLGIPAPYLAAVSVSLLELLGGIALIVGLGTRFVSPLLAFTMLMAGITVHFKNGFYLPQGYEFVLLLGLSAIGLTLTGSGALALDNVLSRGRTQRFEMARRRAA